jgi:hypothetical protein
MNDLVWVWQRPMIEGIWASGGIGEIPSKHFDVDVIRPCANYRFKLFSEAWRCYLGPIPEIKTASPIIERQFLVKHTKDGTFFEYWVEHNFQIHDMLTESIEYFETGKTRKPTTLAERTMFSVKEKRHIADAIQSILRATAHPELPEGEIQFRIHIDGAESWSWADIQNNGAVKVPAVNPWNELASSAVSPRSPLPTKAELDLMTRLQIYGEVWIDVMENSDEFDAVIELVKKGLGKITLHGKSYIITKIGDWG